MRSQNGAGLQVRAATVLLLGCLLTMACGPASTEMSSMESGPVEAGVSQAPLLETASYDVQLQVPTCAAVAAGCDTGPSQVNGRGPLGPEPKAPNTLGGSCMDGTAGAYHMDESADRVKVHTLDGTELAPGKQVLVEVTVWAGARYSSDRLDLYFAADASNPSWSFLTTLTPKAAGAQTLKATYTLPWGGTVQAVRAAFHDGNASLLCSTEGLADRDDLAFAVAGSASVPVFVSFATGGSVVAVDTSGAVWTWGNNFSLDPQAAGPSAPPRLRAPVKVPGLSSVKAVAAGNLHALALRTDGTVWAWGNNTEGQLGDGTLLHRSTPVQVMSGVAAISAGPGHSLALKSDGTVWAWGDNPFGQVGDGTTSDRRVPARVQGLEGRTLKAIAAGSVSSLAVGSDGTVWAWGDNHYGQLGDGTNQMRTRAVKTLNLTGITAVSAAPNHSLALHADGTVWAWGDNSRHQLGYPWGHITHTPVRVSHLTQVVSISAGYSHSIAARADGTVWAWGVNNHGQLGTGSAWHSTPTQVLALSGARAVAASDSFSLALDNQGTFWAWGTDGWGSFGNGSDSRPAPVQLPALSGIQALSSGTHHALALDAEGSLWAWGDNSLGHLGDGTTLTRLSPVRLQEPARVTAMAAGGNHSLALQADGTLWAWGYNQNGELGNGTASDIHTRPAQVAHLTRVTAFSAGLTHNLAVTSEGTVWAWGDNRDGQLGDGTTTRRLAAVQVPSLSGITAVATNLGSMPFSLALRDDGTVWAWGNNTVGQLGDGTTAHRSTPVRVVGLTGIVAISAGWNHALALKADGTVWAWGNNFRGQLGMGDSSSRMIPVQVPGLTGVTSLVASTTYSLAVRGDGTTWGWGINDATQLGDSVLAFRSLSPIRVQGLTGVAAVGAGDRRALALKSDGTVWAWGSNDEDAMGDGRSIRRDLPGTLSQP